MLILPQMKERGSTPTERTINFYGAEVPDQFKNDIKLVTIRKDDPKYHGFKVLETVTAKCEGEDLRLLVWGVQEVIPLNEIDPVVRALDGFLTLEQAVTELKVYPGYENINEESPMTLIATISRDNVLNMHGMSLYDELAGQRRGKSLSEVVRNPDLQGLIKPAIANWFFLRRGNSENWLNFFAENGLLDRGKLKDIEDYEKKGQPRYFDKKVFGSRRVSRFLLTHQFYDGRGSQEADWDYRNLYLPFVMGDLSQITRKRFHSVSVWPKSFHRR